MTQIKLALAMWHKKPSDHATTASAVKDGASDGNKDSDAAVVQSQSCCADWSCLKQVGLSVSVHLTLDELEFGDLSINVSARAWPVDAAAGLLPSPHHANRWSPHHPHAGGAAHVNVSGGGRVRLRYILLVNLRMAI